MLTFSHTSLSSPSPTGGGGLPAPRGATAHVLPTHPSPTAPPPPPHTQVVAASQRQGLLLTWTPDSVHFLQLAYETFNDLLLNILCPLQPARVHH